MSLNLPAILLASVLAPGWTSYGGNAQHTAEYLGSSQSLQQDIWHAGMDDDRNYYGTDVLAHYASPVVTPRNTVVYAYRFNEINPDGSTNYDNWHMIARAGQNGNEQWTVKTDYSAPLVWPTDWTSVFPLATVPVTGPSGITTGAACAAAGGTILIKADADSPTSALNRVAFYTTFADYTANAAAYAPIKVNTPITSDGNGNIYFGYIVTAAVPSSLSALGSGGLVIMNASNHTSRFVSVQAMGVGGGMGQIQDNAAPALSNDGTSVYIALCPTLQPGWAGPGYMAKLDVGTLQTDASVAMMDPGVPGYPAVLLNESSASPMVAPDGHVFMGAFRYNYGESHGWMLQYDGNLSSTDANGKTFPVGAFGWDDTASIVPANIVANYTGSAPYLLLTKYNDYADFNYEDSNAIGDNKVALLDPTSNSTGVDRQTGVAVMNVVQAVLGITPDYDFSSPGGPPIGVREWCINSAVVDINKKSAIINSEDGHVYRWDFASNKLTEHKLLEPATGEAYTSTVIGPDGTIYAINNSVLFAIGNNPIVASKRSSKVNDLTAENLKVAEAALLML